MSQLRASRNYVWNVKDILGTGATGAVYKARNKKTGELYAVKTFNANAYGRPRDVQMREYDVLRKLKHENIVWLHAVEDEAGTAGEVLIMDLCTGGSLYSMLDDPENAYGVEEEEFLSVLHDVAAGMKHLRDNDVVHRDIKPGNIMRYITEDGRSIYKLIDFGAARELLEEEQFTSLYGTEEYLFPDMYERAVLHRKTDKPFNANVDLWSIGVTLYHVATGQLPFRPYGGPRKNKELMYALTTQKASGVLSGVQHVADGPIEWSTQLPATCRLSYGLKQLVTPLLASLLESKTDKVVKFDEFFNEVQKISSKHVLNVFHVTTCSLLKIYINRDEKLSQLHDLIAEQTKVSASQHQLVYENHELLTLVSESQPVSTYPSTTSSSPIFLFTVTDQALVMSSLDTSAAVFSSFIPQVPKAPLILKDQVDVDADALYAKNCCAVSHCISRAIICLLRDQQLIIKAAKMYRLILANDVNETHDGTRELESLILEIGKRVELLSSSYGLLYSAVKELSVVKDIDAKCTSNPHIDTFAKQNKRFVEIVFQYSSFTLRNCRGRQLSVLIYHYCASAAWYYHCASRRIKAPYVRLKERVDDIISRFDNLRQLNILQPTLDTLWQEDSSCRETDKCIKKAEILISSIRQTWAEFCHDRGLRRLSFNEEQIHKFDRRKMESNSVKVDQLITSHCMPNTLKMFDHFISWYNQMLKIRSELNELKRKIDVVSVNHQILSKCLDEVQREKLLEITEACDVLGVRSVPYSSVPCVSPETTVAWADNDFVFRAKRSRNKEKNRKAMQVLRSLKDSLDANEQQIAALKITANSNDSVLHHLHWLGLAVICNLTLSVLGGQEAMQRVRLRRHEIQLHRLAEQPSARSGSEVYSQLGEEATTLTT